MFRNLTVPCARRSRGEKSNWMRSCLLAVGASQAWHPGALCYAQKFWRSFQNQIKYHLLQEGLLIPPAGCISASSEPSARCWDMSWGHFSFSPLQEVCLYCCLIVPANLWAPKDRGRDCFISVQSLEENRMVLSVCVKESLGSHQCYDLTWLLLLWESLFIMKQPFLFVPFSLPHVNFLQIREYVQRILGTTLTGT